MVDTHLAEKMCLLESTTKISMKIDPYYQRPTSSFRKYMRILAGIPRDGGVNDSGDGLSTTANFIDFDDTYRPISS